VAKETHELSLRAWQTALENITGGWTGCTKSANAVQKKRDKHGREEVVYLNLQNSFGIEPHLCRALLEQNLTCAGLFCKRHLAIEGVTESLPP